MPSAPESRRSAISSTGFDSANRKCLNTLASCALSVSSLVRAEGRHRLYRVNGPALKPIHDWVRTFERTWNIRLDRLDDLLGELQTNPEKIP